MTSERVVGNWVRSVMYFGAAREPADRTVAALRRWLRDLPDDAIVSPHNRAIEVTPATEPTRPATPPQP